MLPEVVCAQIVQIISTNFTPEEIDDIGKQQVPRFNAHFLSGEPFGMRLQPDRAARILVDAFKEGNILEGLLGTIINIEQNSTLIGRTVKVQGLEQLYQKLGSVGLKYDPAQGKVIAAAKDEEIDVWGPMQEGVTYDFCFLSIDIAGNSEIQRKYEKDLIEKVCKSLLSLIRNNVQRHRGKIWNWAGDGGIAAFYLENNCMDAINCALGIYLSLIPFNLSLKRNQFDEAIHLRIAGHSGPADYKEEKGAIFSEAINYVAHLEKKGTPTDSIAVSKNVFDKLDLRLQGIFTKGEGEFEEIEYYTSLLGFK